MIADEQAERFVPLAMELVEAVRDLDAAGVEEILRRAASTGCDADPLHALCVVLAAAVPIEAGVGQLYAWTDLNFPEFSRLVEAGVDRTTASVLAAGRSA